MAFGGGKKYKKTDKSWVSTMVVEWMEESKYGFEISPK